MTGIFKNENEPSAFGKKADLLLRSSMNFLRARGFMEILSGSGLCFRASCVIWEIRVSMFFSIHPSAGIDLSTLIVVIWHYFPVHNLSITPTRTTVQQSFKSSELTNLFFLASSVFWFSTPTSITLDVISTGDDNVFVAVFVFIQGVSSPLF